MPHDPPVELVPEPTRAQSPSDGQTLSRASATVNQVAGDATRTGTPSGQAVAGRYELVREVGHGGMGVVYETRDRELGRVVALKMVLHGLRAGSEAVARFLAEAEALAAVQHPHVVQVFDRGEYDGLPFFAMEFCPGGSLGARVKENPLPPREAAAIVEQLARGVQAAHDHGILHRDLKPENVLFDAAGTPKLTDFGLAKRLADADAGLTHTGAVMGTPSYMAPEQAAGRAREVGPAADVYGLGAVLYRLVAGRPPFLGADAAETVRQVIETEPVSPTQLTPGLARDLATICLKCLEKDPRKRYLSAAELAADLGRHLGGHPIAARPVGRPERAWRWALRNKGLAVAVTLLTAAGLAVVGLSVGLAVYQSRAADKLRIEQTNVKDALAAALQNERRARIQSAQVAFDRGYGLCFQGDLPYGLLLLAQALERAPPDDTELRPVILANIAAWQRELVPTHPVLHHSGRIGVISFDPTGRTVLTGGWDRTARLWDVATGRPLCDPMPHPGWVTCAAWSRDGTKVITGGRHGPDMSDMYFGAARIWDGRTGAPLSEVLDHRIPKPANNHTSDVNQVAFSADESEVLTVTNDDRVWHWSATSGDLVDMVQVPGRHLGVPNFSADARKLNVADGPLARILDAATLEPDGPTTEPTQYITSTGFSADGSRVLMATGDGWIKVWDTATRRQAGPAMRHTGGWGYSAALSPDGRLVVTGHGDSTARLWDVDHGEFAILPLRHNQNVTRVAFSPDGRYFATGTSLGSVHIWEARSGNHGQVLCRRKEWVERLAISADGGILLVAGDRCWAMDSSSGRQLVPDWDDTGRARYAGLSQDGRTAFTACVNEAGTRDTRTGERIGAVLNRVAQKLSAAAMSPDGLLAATAAGPDLRLWDVPTGRFTGRVISHQGTVTACTFSPDGHWVVTGCEDRAARIWDLATGTLASPPFRHNSAVRCVRISPDGRLLFSGSDDAIGRLWDLTTGRQVGEEIRIDQAIWSADFSPDGRLLLTGSDGSAGRFWDVATGRPIGPGFWHTNVVGGVAFHPDNRTVFTGSLDGTVRRWAIPELPPDDPAAIALRIQVLTAKELTEAGGVRELTPDEWADRVSRLRALGSWK